MNDYGNMLLIAMPIFLLLILVEMFWGRIKHGEQQPVIDTISSLSSGMTNILKSTLGISIVIISYPWMVEHLQVIQLEKGSIWPYVITFVFMDFTGYWMHRLQHRVNFFWNHHIIHHSSEEFNLPCALRQQIAVMTNIYTLVMLPLALLGIPGEVLALVGPIHLFSQFWYHTRYIGNLGILEYILVTPSHHRVHHAMNDLYLDKNYSQIFIVWDRLFGTFQEELETERCVYGMRRPATTWNPYIINFKHLWQLIVDAWRTQNLADKFRIWFMPTGWRPADVEQKYPVFTIGRMSELKKYNPFYSKWFTAFSVLHMSVIFALLCFLFFRFGEIEKSEALLNGIFLLLAIFGFTALLDKKQYGLISMLAVAVAVVVYCISQRDWFGINGFMPAGSVVIALYFSATALAALWFYNHELRQSEAQMS
ncbi:MAG: sterol desaturase family protein [Bacteroidetes bacterium]|nr:sterol desaturase family protein [Bacteroidota bacterium]